MSRLLKIIVSFAKEPYKRDDVLQKRPIILRSLLIVATPSSKLNSELTIYVAYGLFYKALLQKRPTILLNGELTV